MVGSTPGAEAGAGGLASAESSVETSSGAGSPGLGSQSSSGAGSPSVGSQP